MSTTPADPIVGTAEIVCSQCSTSNPPVARFCHKCGSVLEDHLERGRHYAAQPTESVRALALVSTLMPHLSARRHHVYRVGLTFAVGGAMVAAGFGLLPVALICAGVALPGMLLTYFYDHELWSDEPWFMLGLSIGLAGALGVGLGVLGNYFSNNGLYIGIYSSLPSMVQLLNGGLLIPLITLTLLLIPPALMTLRPKFRHVLDTVTIAALGAAAFSLGETLVIQHGAFSSLTATGTDAARDAFTALTLGFVKPVIYATASAFALLRFRRRGSAPVGGVVISYVLIAVYDAVDVTLSNYGQSGVVLNFVVAVALAVIGLLLVRNEVHAALLNEAKEAQGVELAKTPAVWCPNCQLPVQSGANFCLACGMAVPAMPKQLQAVLGATGTPGPEPGGEEHRRLHGKLHEPYVVILASAGVAAIAGFVCLLVLTGSSGPGPSSSRGPLTAGLRGLGGHEGAPVALGNNLAVAPAAGWATSCTGNCSNQAHLVAPDRATVAVFEGATNATPNATSELAAWQQDLSTGGGAIFSSFSTGNVTDNPLQTANTAGMTSMAYESFTGVISNNQGTTHIYGDLVVFLNVPGHYEVREYYYATSAGELRLEQSAINRMEATFVGS